MYLFWKKIKEKRLRVTQNIEFISDNCGGVANEVASVAGLSDEPPPYDSIVFK